MFNSKFKIVFFLIVISQVLGCGRSGEGTEQATPLAEKSLVDGTEVQTTSTISENTQQDAIEISELRASSDFDFTTKQQVSVTLDLRELLSLNNQTGQRVYISIYSDYKLLQSGQFYPDSSSRVLAGELHDGQFNNTFISLNKQSTYLIEAWFYNGEQPVQKAQTVVEKNISW